MRYFLTFVGVDRYADVRVRDLSGAANDARALWALFADTFSDADAHLLVDSHATMDSVRGAFRHAMLDAGPEDVAVIFFGGHGTRDHQLVLHDTDRGRLSETALPMQEIADLFRNTKARAALLILDCCFSGGVTARVIDDSPASRDMGDPLSDVAGMGRVIITASNFNEPAYEAPGHDHGLLTKALLESFAAGVQTSILALMDVVMSKVRAEAARLGVEQNPSFLGDIQGGFVLPQLIRGKNYDRLFPPSAQAKISTAISDLKVFQFPQGVLDEWGMRFPGGLNELQVAAVNDHSILSGQSLLVIAPTSAGKTFIGEMAAAKAITEGRKAVFLLPYRALVNEKYDQFLTSYGEGSGMRVVRCTGDYTDQAESFVRGKYDLALLTYEMFLNLVVSVPSTLQQLGLVVLDEAQFITDPNRGITVELLLTYLIAARDRGISPQLISLSAVIGDANRFQDWLGTGMLKTDRRPVPLTEGVLDRSGTFFYLTDENKIATRALLSSRDILIRREEPSAQDVLVPLIRQLVANGQKVLVFRNMRPKTEGCANYLARDLGLPPAQAALDSLPVSDASSSSTALRRALGGGVAFHNSNLTREERDVVERAYRDPNSSLRVLVATTTVAAGINTPASTAIIAEQEFIGDDGRPFTVAEYKNMAGRAGRLGFNETGTSIILAETSVETQNVLNRYVLGRLESLKSSFDSSHLDTWLLRLLAQVRKIPRAEVSRLLANTYAGYLAAQSDPQWRVRMTNQVETLLARMLGLGLLEQEGAEMQLTLLGRACGRSNLSLPSSLRLIEVLRSINPTILQPQTLIAFVQVLPESDSGYTPMFKRGQKESARVQEAASRFGSEVVRHLQRNVADNFEYWARCKRAAVLWDWMAGDPVDVIEQRYSISPYQGKLSHGDIRRFADASRWCLRSVQEIVSIMFPERTIQADGNEALIRSLEAGVPRQALGLLDPSVPLARGEILALWRTGITTISEFRASNPELLKSILGASRTALLFPSASTASPT